MAFSLFFCIKIKKNNPKSYHNAHYSFSFSYSVSRPTCGMRHTLVSSLHVRLMIIILWFIITINIFNLKKKFFCIQLYSIVLCKKLNLVFLTYYYWFESTYPITSRCQLLFNHHHISLYLNLKGREIYLVNPDLAQNTQGRVYPYIAHSVIVFPKYGYLYYLAFVQRLLIYIFSIVQREIPLPVIRNMWTLYVYHEYSYINN